MTLQDAIEILTDVKLALYTEGEAHRFARGDRVEEVIQLLKSIDNVLRLVNEEVC